MSQVQQMIANLLAQALLHNQLIPADPKVLVLVLDADRQTVLGCNLRPFSEIASLVGMAPDDDAPA